MEYNVLVVEDNPKARKMLVSMLKDLDVELNILDTDNIDTAYRYAVQYNIHLFLLDIVLDTSVRGDTAGMTFATHVLEFEKYRKTPIIFITSLEDYKLFAYSELHCYQYIEKPFDQEQAMCKIREALGLVKPEEKERFTFFRKDGILFSVKLDKIQYIICDKPVTQIFMTDDLLEISYIPINKILLQLNSSEFVQCNRNMVINKNHLDNVDTVNNYVRLKKIDASIPLGNAYKKKVLGEK